uniref:Elongation factor P C-terminal domain-containing protein n=1 Tax=Biomphalaria glabrata TaxID=6526 RepID=A0A2C9KUH1_BIOGL
MTEIQVRNELEKFIQEITYEELSFKRYGDNFTHGLGHGLGVEIHENPRFTSADPTFLDNKMVGTIEPGIYLEGIGGVRIEDDIVINNCGDKVKPAFIDRVVLPLRVELTVAEAEDAVKGNSTSNPQKSAVLETGYKIQVPIFIKSGEKVIVDTVDGVYVSRA